MHEGEVQLAGDTGDRMLLGATDTLVSDAYGAMFNGLVSMAYLEQNWDPVKKYEVREAMAKIQSKMQTTEFMPKKVLTKYFLELFRVGLRMAW